MIKRIVALDGLRGAAAMLVAFYHFTGTAQPQHGYLAVDLFFMLSGFVLAGVYEDRLRDGMTMGAFMSQRLARLYPVYLLGVVIAFKLMIPNMGLGAASRALAFNLAFLPDMAASGPSASYWLDPPTWSLSLEMLINLVVGLGAWRLSTRALAIVVGVGLALYVVAAAALGAAAGNETGVNYLAGWARLLFAFPLGWLVWRLRDKLRPYAAGASSYAALGAFALALFLPGNAEAIVATIALFPFVLTVMAFGPQPRGLAARVATVAGGISYALYVTHLIVEHLLVNLPWIVTPVAALAFAWAIHRAIEPMGRRLVLRLLEGRNGRPPPSVTAEANA